MCKELLDKNELRGDKSVSKPSSGESAKSRNGSLPAIEPLFGRHWEDESEMDRSLKILKQKHAATIRVRKMNDVHNRLLEGKIRLLRNSFSNELKELTRETRCLQDEFGDLEPTPRLKLPRIESATPAESRSSSALSGKSRAVSVNSRETVCQTCLFDPENTTLRCRHFPCFLPKTYNSIGFMPKPQTYSIVSNYKQLMSRCTDLRPPTSMSREAKPANARDAEVVVESHAPRTTIKEKIRGVKQLVKEMKERNEKTKPRDWAVNYGDPMPRRILLKPVKSIC